MKGLAYHVSYNKLWEDFAHAGAIESIDMPMRANGWNEGFAFVKYTAACLICYQYRPPEAGDRVLGCIRPAG